MSMRPLIKSLMACVVASASVALMTAAPAAAEEAPVWWSNNNHELTTVHVPTILWGELKLSSTAVGEIHCINGISGAVWNEGTPLRGHGKEEGWGTNACKAPQLEEALESIFKKKVTVYATAELPLEKEIAPGRSLHRRIEDAAERMPECVRTRTAGIHLEGAAPAFQLPLELRTLPRDPPRRRNRLSRRSASPRKPARPTCYPTPNGEAPSWETVPNGCVKIDRHRTADSR